MARLAVSFFLKDELLLSPTQVSALLGIVALPWIIKPVFGFISDGLPIFGYRRRPYLILSGILGTISWVCLATIVHTTWAATCAIALGSLSVAVSDVIVDSLVVERARAESQADAGSLQSICWGASAFGGLLTAYLSGWLLEHFSTHTVFGITALFPLLVSSVAWLIAESPVSKDSQNPQQRNSPTIKHQLGQLRKAVTQKAIWLPTAFVFIWQATPTADSAFFFFTTNELHFAPVFYYQRIALCPRIFRTGAPSNKSGFISWHLDFPALPQNRTFPRHLWLEYSLFRSFRDDDAATRNSC